MESMKDAHARIPQVNARMNRNSRSAKLEWQLLLRLQLNTACANAYCWHRIVAFIPNFIETRINCFIFRSKFPCQP